MSSALTAAECRRRYAGAFRPNPWIYWGDFSLSAGIGWGAFAFSLRTPLTFPLYCGATLIAVIALLRAAIFIHELAHLKRGAVPGFETGWNLVIGIPFMLPSLMYVGSHGDHHRQSAFGTANDPEYAPLAHHSRPQILGFLMEVIFVPLLLALRWGLIGPLSFVIPPLRRIAVEQASSLVINTGYRRPFPTGRATFRWWLQEIATALVFWSVIGAWMIGVVPSSWLVQWYVVSASILFINQVRTLAAHRYINDGRTLTAVEQLRDSINLDGWPIPTVLAAPVGLRYHALHHFLPAVPYHSLGALHRRLLVELPLDSPYHHATSRGILLTIWTLIARLQPTPRRQETAKGHIHLTKSGSG
ncbi:MAG: fatty acid desaturase [Deltaproteobacteria bacterium]|nr:fatty acid desaturase [Deltaproteobacteria bacterium]